MGSRGSKKGHVELPSQYQASQGYIAVFSLKKLETKCNSLPISPKRTILDALTHLDVQRNTISMDW